MRSESQINEKGVNGFKILTVALTDLANKTTAFNAN